MVLGHRNRIIPQKVSKNALKSSIAIKIEYELAEEIGLSDAFVYEVTCPAPDVIQLRKIPLIDEEKKAKK